MRSLLLMVGVALTLSTPDPLHAQPRDSLPPSITLPAAHMPPSEATPTSVSSR